MVGATTLIFAIILELTHGLDAARGQQAVDPAPAVPARADRRRGDHFELFTGASMQAVTTGAYRAVEFIKANIRLDDTVVKASTEDSKKVRRDLHEVRASGDINIFLSCSSRRSGSRSSTRTLDRLPDLDRPVRPLSSHFHGQRRGCLGQRPKKIVETELKMKGTDLHAATVVGDTVGDPFKDTSSVALNPIIKFTTLFGVLAVALSESLKVASEPTTLTVGLAAGFLAVSMVFVWRSFYGMRIKETEPATTT